MLGLFKNVSLGGAALAVDQLLDGGITQTLSRRMFSGNVGELSILPTGRHPIRANFVAFAGLGPIDSFSESTLETVGENLIRSFVTANVGDFATVLMGGASGMIAKAGLARLLKGFVRGLLDADRDQVFHRVTICENDPARYAQLTHDLYALCGGTLFDGVQVTLRTRDLPAAPAIQAARAQMPGSEAIYLLVRQMDDEQDRPGIVASVLTKGRKAAIHRGWQPLDETALAGHLAQVANGVPANLDMRVFGETLVDLVLPKTIQTVLAQFPGDHIVVVHDARASRIPGRPCMSRDVPSPSAAASATATRRTTSPSRNGSRSVRNGPRSGSCSSSTRRRISRMRGRRAIASRRCSRRRAGRRCAASTAGRHAGPSCSIASSPGPSTSSTMPATPSSTRTLPHAAASSARTTRFCPVPTWPV